jgi:hypothetical protein
VFGSKVLVCSKLAHDEQSRNPEACFLSGIKALFIEHRGYKDLRRAAEGGHDAAAYLYASLLFRDNGSAATDDTAKGT